ncbi:hypothetical protein C2E23DRAFT_832049 [Lenzites betulinus]|nr:hypothetical protein C2E23DRAFT_832049 [Lenzites betulinus]
MMAFTGALHRGSNDRPIPTHALPPPPGMGPETRQGDDIHHISWARMWPHSTGT